MENTTDALFSGASKLNVLKLIYLSDRCCLYISIYIIMLC
jgi:hypothetical protein